MSTSQTALLVIDAQQSFEHRPYWSVTDTPEFFDRLQALIDGAKARHVPIVQILHAEESGVFSPASGFVKTLAALSIATGRNGRHWTAAEIEERTELVREGRFARILTVKEALAAIDRATNDVGRQVA
jgi:nicotinamidase-related amidase